MSNAVMIHLFSFFFLQLPTLPIILQDDQPNERIVKSVSTVVETNQHRMCMDPFESMLASMGYQVHNGAGIDASIMQEVPTCRTS